jgi:hypothetical protein
MPAPIQTVESDQQLNGTTPHQDEPQQLPTPASQQSIVVAITSPPFGGSDASQTLPDEDGNV